MDKTPKIWIGFIVGDKQFKIHFNDGGQALKAMPTGTGTSSPSGALEIPLKSLPPSLKEQIHENIQTLEVLPEESLSVETGDTISKSIEGVIRHTLNQVNHFMVAQTISDGLGKTTVLNYSTIEEMAEVVSIISRNPAFFPLLKGVVQFLKRAIQEILSAGWANTILKNKTRARLAELLAQIASLEGLPLIGELQALAAVLQGLYRQGRPQKPSETFFCFFLEEHLAFWTQYHNILRMTQRYDTNKPNATQWETIQQDLLACLKAYYRHKQATAGTVKPVASSRHFLNRTFLWLCYRLLEGELDLTGQEDFKLRLYCDLTYIVRECIRHDLFGGSDFPCELENEGFALATLTETYVTHFLHVPSQLGLREHLYNLGRITARNPRYQPAQFLNHMIQIFMVGNFMLDLGGPEGTSTLASELLGGAGNDEKKLELARAFSLAALFHDVGHLINPLEENTNASLLELSNLGLDLSTIGATYDDLGSQIVSHCAAVMEQNGYHTCIPSSGWKNWISRQRETGKPDHGLLGAWYLQQIYERFNTHSTGGGEGKHDSLTNSIVAAIRAILMHDLVSETINVEKDPAAALLSFSNEILEWPNRYLSLPLEMDPRISFVMNTNQPAFQPVYQAINFLDINSTSEFFGYQQGHLPDGPGEILWPVIEVELRPSDALNIDRLTLMLLKAQCLGRIPKDSLITGWRPAFSIRLDKKDKDEIFEQLSFSSNQIQGRFNGFLTDLMREWKQHSREGAILLRATDIAFRTLNLREWIPELERLLNRHKMEKALALPNKSEIDFDWASPAEGSGKPEPEKCLKADQVRLISYDDP